MRLLSPDRIFLKLVQETGKYYDIYENAITSKKTRQESENQRTVLIKKESSQS